MLPVLQPAQLGRELAACTILGAAVGVVRAFFPVRGRGAFVPDALLTGAVLFGVQSYAAALSSAGVLRWYMVLAAFAAALCTAAVGHSGAVGRAVSGVGAGCSGAPCPAMGAAAAGAAARGTPRSTQRTPERKKNRKKSEKELAKPAPCVV